MITIRKSNDRGRSQIGWLDSFHTFSFADYYDPNFMGYGPMRVINEDTVRPGMGFDRHPHNNMEIISYVVDGALAHQDSMDNGSVIKPGELQMMTAGTGVEHSEYNYSKADTVHFLQIWIKPEQQNLTPSYQQVAIQKSFNEFILIGSQHAEKGALIIHQDVKLYVAFLTKDAVLGYSLSNQRMAWLQLIRGGLKLNDQILRAGDGAAIQDEDIHITCLEDAEFLLFDLKKS